MIPKTVFLNFHRIPWRLRACTLISGTLALAALAPTETQADALATLLATKRCEVVDRLRRIHATPDPADAQNRFLILSRVDKPQDYVQCAFDRRDRHMLCEAASGYFYDVPRTMHLAPSAIAALGRLGFSHDDAAPQNFRQAFAVADPPNLVAIADLMLKALFVGYDVRAATPLTFDAPDAPGPSGACGGSATKPAARSFSRLREKVARRSRVG